MSKTERLARLDERKRIREGLKRRGIGTMWCQEREVIILFTLENSEFTELGYMTSENKVVWKHGRF